MKLIVEFLRRPATACLLEYGDDEGKDEQI